MKTISLTGLGIAGAIQAIQKHMDEQIEKAKKPKSSEPDFPYTIDRTLDGQGELELAIEVKHYHAPGDNKYLDSRDPQYDSGWVVFGDAIEVATGKTIELTPAEWEAIEREFWN